MTTSKPSLCFVNRCYWPDSEATGQLLTELTQQLSDDFDVHVICGQPNAPETNDFVDQGRQVREGVTIHRLPHTRFRKKIPAGRLLNLISFTRATSKYLRRCPDHFDVLISETDPFLLPPTVAKAARRRSARFVAYLQDIYPDVAIAIGKAKSGWLTNYIRNRLRAAYRQADRIIVLGRCMRSRLTVEPWNLEEQDIVTVANWADTDLLQPIPPSQNAFRRLHQLEAHLVLMHSGNMGMTQRLSEVVHCVDDDQWPDRALLLLVGDGAKRETLQQQAKQFAPKSANRIRFLPYQPRQLLGESLSAADIHLVSMDAGITGCLCPSKLYGILAVGRPVIAICDDASELSMVIREHRIGICVPPGNREMLLHAISQLADDETERKRMGERARELALSTYNRNTQTEAVRHLLIDICQSQLNRRTVRSEADLLRAKAGRRLVESPVQPRSSQPSSR